jgi:hypothetical protein
MLWVGIGPTGRFVALMSPDPGPYPGSPPLLRPTERPVGPIRNRLVFISRQQVRPGASGGGRSEAKEESRGQAAARGDMSAAPRPMLRAVRHGH